MAGISETKCMTYADNVVNGDSSLFLRLEPINGLKIYIDLPTYASKIIVFYNNGNSKNFPCILVNKENVKIQTSNYAPQLLPGEITMCYVYNNGEKIELQPIMTHLSEAGVESI